METDYGKACDRLMAELERQAKQAKNATQPA